MTLRKLTLSISPLAAALMLVATSPSLGNDQDQKGQNAAQSMGRIVGIN